MIKRTTVFIIILLLSCVVTAFAQEAYYTPTPDADGGIWYVVKSNDSCLSISLLNGVNLDTLKEINGLDDECSLTAGTKLKLGQYNTPTPTPGPSPTPTPITPTPTPFAGYAKVCVFLYEDINGNQIVDDPEYAITGGAVSIGKRSGSESFTGLTSGWDPLCFENVPEGDYNVSVAPPTEYNPTNNLNHAITVHAGDSILINFGAQKNGVNENIVADDTGTTKNPLFLLLGAGCMFLGSAMVIIFGVVKRKNRD